METPARSRISVCCILASLIAMIAFVLILMHQNDQAAHLAPSGTEGTEATTASNPGGGTPGAKKFDHLDVYNHLTKPVTQVKIQFLNKDGNEFGFQTVEVDSLPAGESLHWVYGFTGANDDYVAAVRCELMVKMLEADVEKDVKHICKIEVPNGLTLRTASFRIGERYQPEGFVPEPPVTERFYLAGEGLTEDKYSAGNSRFFGHTDYNDPSPAVN